MRNILYVIIPSAAFVLILLNALFGHMLFASDSEQVANKYSIYVHFQPEWNSSPRNLIFDVTNSWFKHDLDRIENVTYNPNQIVEVNGKSVVELRHDYSDCRDEWTPILYRRAIDAVRHEIEYLQGTQLDADPGISIYPDVDNSEYDAQSQASKLRDGYAQFIPICTSEQQTSYDYSIRIDSEKVGFDAYFVSSEDSRDSFFESGFEHYESPECFVQNKNSVSGTCPNIGRDAGLLLLVPDELDAGVTKITVNLYETP